MNELDLHGYQVNTIKHIEENHFAGAFLDMGLGKTVSTLTAIKRLMFEELDITRVLVIAPKRVAETVWSAELQKWDHLHGITLSKVVGTEKQRTRALQSRADIYIIGRDNVAWICKYYEKRSLPFDMLVIDESSSFKNPKSQRFKTLRKLQPKFKRVVILTGTPAPNGLLDLWSQIFLLDRGERLGRFLTTYRDEYFAPDARNGSIVYSYKPKKDSDKKIQDKIGDICISMKAEDYIDMPDVILNDIMVEFPEELQARYDKFEEDQIMESLEGDCIGALNAAALSNKLLQFANGAVYDEDHIYHEVHSLKLEAAEEIVEQAGGKPVLIAWTYRHDLYRLKEYLKKYNPRELLKEQDILDWNDGKIQVLLTHPASGGHGLNLQYGGNIIVWFGQTWSLELYEQLNARLNRQGQTQTFILNRILASKTMDLDVIKSLAGKTKTQDGLMEAIKYRIQKYTDLQ